MKKIFTLLFLTACIYSYSQNLVPNPGFEVQDSCPAVSELFVCQPWYSPTPGSPDAFNSTCPTQSTPAHTGIGCAGVFTYSTFPNNREYMQAPLTTPLTGGQVYSVSFWVKRANFRYAINRIGAYLSVGAISSSVTSALPYTPQVENPASNMLSASTSTWVLISGSFTASGGEDHITIGNFSNDAQTDTLVVNSSSTSFVSYYYVDDVSVTAGVGINEIYGNENLVSVFPNPSAGRFSVEGEILKKSGVKIYNSAGEMVYESLAETMKEEIDLSAFPRGIYLMRINTGKEAAVKRIIIQ